MLLQNFFLASLLAVSCLSNQPLNDENNEARRAPVCYRDNSVMNYKQDKHGSPYSRSEGCKHYTFGTDKVWYQDYLTYYECPTCGNKTGTNTNSVEVNRECYGYN